MSRASKRLQQRAGRGRRQGVSVAAPAPAPAAEPVHVTSLPPEIIQKILGLVTVATLKNLRLASKVTKTWVDNDGTILARLPVRAKTGTDLRKFRRSKVKWNNLILDFHGWRREDLCSLLEDFQPQLRRIQLCNWISCSSLLDLISELGPQVNTIVIWNIDGSLEALRKFSTPEAQATLRNNLSQLKEFEIDGDTNSSGLTFLQFIWENLSDLHTIKVPFSMMRKFTAPPLHTPGLEFFCSEPILAFLNAIGANRRRTEEIRIEFCKKWFVQSGPTSWAQFEQSDLYVISELCRTNGVRLYNVPLQYLPYSQILTPGQKLSLERSIGSVVLKNLPTGLKNYYLPPDCPLSISICKQPGQHMDYTEFGLPDYGLNLVFINWDIENGFQGREIVFDQLFGQLRPNVTRLTFKEPASQLFKNLKLSDVTPNLKKIHLSLKRYWNERNLNILQPLCGLTELEDITLDDTYLPKNCLVKLDGEPRLLDFPKLQHLRILKCYICDWSNEIFSTSFKFLKLKSLVCTRKTWRMKVPNITFEGLKLLNTVDGGLKDTLENFECFAPLDCIDETINTFLSGFNNLRKSTIHFPKRGARTLCQQH